MTKEKSKSGSLGARSVLTGPLWLMGLISAVGLVYLFASFLQSYTYRSKPIPMSQRYHLTGDSYLKNWHETRSYDISHEDVRGEPSVSLSGYRKPSSAPGPSDASVSFFHYDNVDRAKGLFETFSSRSNAMTNWFEPFGDELQFDSLKADRFQHQCIYIARTVTRADRYSCDFNALYGTCYIGVDSDITDPDATLNDFKQLIEDYIDPQMAAWDVCYPDRQAG